MEGLTFAFAHVDVNAEHKEEAVSFRDVCRNILGLDAEPTPISHMVGNG